MSTVNDFRYDLYVQGANEKTLSEFANALQEKRFSDYIAQDSSDPKLFSSEVLGGYSGYYEENIENELHQLAMQFPSLHLRLDAEDLDNRGYAYQLIFQGNTFQRSEMQPEWSEPCPPVPFEDRHKALQVEQTRSKDASEKIYNLCKNTDYDLLYAQKQTLLESLKTGNPVPKEALEGLVNYLDQVGDLGEVLGLFQYEGMDPPYPLQPEYIKRNISIRPDPPEKIYVLCEEFEDRDAIREFQVLAVSRDKILLQRLLKEKAEKDEYGYFAEKGFSEDDADHVCSNFENGFVEYYIVDESVLKKEQPQIEINSKSNIAQQSSDQWGSSAAKVHTATEELAMGLYQKMLETHNKDNAAFYIATNLSYLARCAEPDKEIPLDTLYRISERLYLADGAQPFLNEERLDAVRSLLENGLSDTWGSCIGNLSAEETPDFLLDCNEDTFIHIIEETAYANQVKYAPEFTQWDDIIARAANKELQAFKSNSEKADLATIISDAKERCDSKDNDRVQPSKER